MSDSPGRADIRRLLKRFGIQADETLLAHLESHPSSARLQVRIALTDLTDYGPESPDPPLHLVVEGEIRREST